MEPVVDTPENQSGPEEVSQADIDALLSGDAAAQAAAAPDAVDATFQAAGFNQDDIDALLNGDPAPTEEAAPSEPVEPDTRVDTAGRPFDEQAAVTPPAATPPPQPFEPNELAVDPSLGIDPKRVTMLSDVKLRVKIQLGQTKMLVEDVLKLGEGSVVELDKLAGDPVDVLVNDRLVARGEVLVLNDNFCVRVSEVLSHDPHRITI